MSEIDKEFRKFIPEHRTKYVVFELLQQCDACVDDERAMCSGCRFDVIRLDEALRDIIRRNSYVQRMDY